MKKMLLCLIFTVTLLWGVCAFAGVVPYGYGTQENDYNGIAQRNTDYQVTVVQNGTEYSADVYSICRETGTQIRDDYRRFAEFEFDGEVDIKITSSKFDLSKSQIIPSKIAHKATYEDGTVTVHLDENCNFAINVGKDSRTTLGIFAYAPEAEDEIFTESSANVKYYGAGYHQENTLTLRANQTLYLAPGCILDANVTVTGNGAKILGRGILRDSTYNSTAGETQYAIKKMLFINSNVSDITVKDIKILDNKGYGIVGNGGNKNILIDNVHLMSNKANSDAISFWGGAENLTVKNCYVSNGDNAFIFRGNCKNVLFTDSIVGTSVAVVAFSNDLTGDNVKVKNIAVFETNTIKIPSVSLVINNAYNAVYNPAKKYGVTGFVMENIDATYCKSVPRLFSGNGVGEEIKNFTFKNVYLPPESINGINILCGGGYNFNLENVWIGDRLADSDEAINLLDNGIGTSVVNYSYTDTGVKIFVNGYLAKLDAEPVMQNNTLLVPLSFVSKELHAPAVWNSEENKAVIGSGDSAFFVTSENGAAYINGVCYVPFTFVAGELGAYINYNAASNSYSVEGDAFSIVTEEGIPQASGFNTNLLGNADIEEENLTDGANYGWASHNDCFIRKETGSGAQSGNSHLHITDRKFSYSGVCQDIWGQLKANGMGKYKISGYFRTPDASSALNGKKMYISVSAIGTGDSKQRSNPKFFNITSEWQYIEKVCNVYWVGDLMNGKFIAAGSDNIVHDFCADNLRLEKVADFEDGELESLIEAERTKEAAALKQANIKSQPPIIKNSTCDSTASYSLSVTNKPSVTLTCEQEDDGNKYLRLSNRSENYFGIDQTLGLKLRTGKKYKIEFKGKIVGDTTNSSTVAIFFLSKSNPTLKGYKRINGVGSEWQTFTEYYTPTFEADDLKIQFRPDTSAIDNGDMTSYDFCIDDIAVTEE